MYTPESVKIFRRTEAQDKTFYVSLSQRERSPLIL